MRGDANVYANRHIRECDVAVYEKFGPLDIPKAWEEGPIGVTPFQSCPKFYRIDVNPLWKGTVKRETPKVGRNDPCPCGSGKKYKKCCGRPN